jgi:hypothetical protein
MKGERNAGSKLLPKIALGYASCFLPAFLAAAHLFFIANASRFRPAGLISPRRGAAVRFDAVPSSIALLAAQRFLVAAMILRRPSGLLRGWPLLPGVITIAKDSSLLLPEEPKWRDRWQIAAFQAEK